MNIYESLKNDHAHILSLIDRAASLVETNLDAAKPLTHELAHELAASFRSEEAVFYNSLRKCASEEALGLEGFAKHLEIEALLKAIQFFNSANSAWLSGIERLGQITRDHFKHEETVLFVVAQTYLTDEEAELIGKAYEELKRGSAAKGVVSSCLEYIANLMPGRFALDVDSIKAETLAGTRERLTSEAAQL